MSACGESPSKGIFSAFEESRQFGCACNDTIDGKSACDVKIKESVRTCVDNAYDATSDANREIFDCIDDQFFKFATCVNELDGCDTEGVQACQPFLVDDGTCGDPGSAFAACDINDVFE